MKKIISILCILILVLGVSGCMNRNSNIQNKMISYINEKYDDSFEFLAPYGGGIGAKNKQILVKSNKMPSAQIWVACYEDGEFSDNYVDYKYEELTREYLKEYLSQIFDCDVKIQYSVSLKGSRNAFDDNTSFEEYIVSDESNITINVVVSEEFNKEDEIINILKDKVCNDNIIRLADIYFAANQSQYNEFNGSIAGAKKIVYSKNVEDDSCNCEWR